ncbi:MAG: hypothetical protein KAR07_03965 [Spirochaetes bacterium]|nr:hypothetical protein [Spirochaetota bacterium]
MKIGIILIFLFILIIPGISYSSLFNVYFWNIDSEEFGLAGSVSTRSGYGYGLNFNPATLPVYKNRKYKSMQQISLINAFRMVSLLVREAGSLPYDAVDSDEKWEDTKHHLKWSFYSFLSIYRIYNFYHNFTFAFIPLKEIPSIRDSAISSSSLVLSAKFGGIFSIGIEGNYYFMTDKDYLDPFAIADKNVNTREGFGGSIGLLMDLKNIKISIDYRSLPSTIFPYYSAPGFPYKDDALSLGLFYRISENFNISFDLVNFNNKNRDDFLSPRAGLEWIYFNRGLDKGKIYFGAFMDNDKKSFFTTGVSLNGIMDGFKYKLGFSFIFDIEKSIDNALVISFVFST